MTGEAPVPLGTWLLMCGLVVFMLWAVRHTSRQAGWWQDERDGDEFAALMDAWRREDLVDGGLPLDVALGLPPEIVRALWRQQQRRLERAMRLAALDGGS